MPHTQPTLAQQLAQHLPFLRRYARALCGTQHGGDAYVGSTLEAILADQDSLRAAIDLRVGLYQVFSRLWNSVDANVREGGEPQLGEFDKSLGALTPLPRQAFLLTSVEGFSSEEAAAILACSPGDIRELVAEAGREMGNHVATDVLIIEDEPMIAMDLEGLVEALGHQVTTVARTHTEAVTAAKSMRPGLILADIQLADGSSGLDAVNELLQQIDVPVIFITAYPERLLTGERPEPAFLLTKPYNPTMLSALISQALFFDQRAQRKAA